MAVFWGIIGAVILAYIICAARDALRERLRQRAFQRLAVKLGLRYQARDDDLVQRLGLAHALREGKHRKVSHVRGAPVPPYAFNVLSGNYAGLSVRTFDYNCNLTRSGTKGMSELDVYCIGVVLFEQQRPFPPLLIFPGKRWMRLEQMVKLERVKLEAAEFAQAFVVRTQDRQFAYDICHARMMEYLLQHRDLSLEIEGRCVAMSFSRRLKPEEVPGRLQQLIEIRRLFPDYLYRD